MTETRAVLLAFTSVAFVMVAGTALFVWSFVVALAEPPPDAAEGQAVNKIFEAKTGTFGPVRGLDRILPVGLAWSMAETLLAASKFACKPSEAGRTCMREARLGPCRYARRIKVGLGLDRHITSTTVEETPICL